VNVYILSPFRFVAVLTVAVLVCRRFDHTPAFGTLAICWHPGKIIRRLPGEPLCRRSEFWQRFAPDQYRAASPARAEICTGYSYLLVFTLFNTAIRAKLVNSNIVCVYLSVLVIAWLS